MILLNLTDAAEHARLLHDNARLQESMRLQQEAQRVEKAAPFVEVMATLPAGERKKLLKKPDVKTLRMYADRSPWVRAAINVYRDAVGRAEYKLVPINRDKRVNVSIERQVRTLLEEPNPANEAWTLIKEKAIEDYLVVGHGPIEKKVRNNATPYQLYALDAASFGFVHGWNGTQPRLPRYAITTSIGGVDRWLANVMAMVPTNTPRSYTELGLSHVESLHKTVMLLLAGDDFFLEQALDPQPQGAINLGSGFNKAQIDQLRAEIQEVRKAFAIISGPEKLSYVNFRLTEEQLRLLDTQQFYIRQVAAIFGISTAKLRLAVDTSRANTSEMFDDDLEGPASLLSRWEQMENRELVGAFGRPEETNLKIVYPILSHRDEKRQAEISKIQMGSTAWVSMNEARQDGGNEQIELPIANQPLVVTPNGPVPLEWLNAKFYDESGKLKPIPEMPDAAEKELPAKAKADAATLENENDNKTESEDE